MYGNTVCIEELEGKVFSSIIISDDKTEVIFRVDDNEVYIMNHIQDCCEKVSLEDITGTLDMLINTPIVLAYELSSTGDNNYGTFTYTFYHLATVKGYVTLRWYGESNGHYSEEVSIIKL